MGPDTSFMAAMVRLGGLWHQLTDEAGHVSFGLVAPDHLMLMHALAAGANPWHAPP